MALTTNDIDDVIDRRYVTDAQLIILSSMTRVTNGAKGERGVRGLPGMGPAVIVEANGVSGTIEDPLNEPAITIILGDITPTSVAATGTVTGSNLSGNNTGDQEVDGIEYITISNTTPSTLPTNTGAADGMAIGSGAVVETGSRAIALGMAYASGVDAIAIVTHVSDDTPSDYGAHVSNSFCHGWKNLVSESSLDTGYGNIILDGDSNVINDSEECAIISSYQSTIENAFGNCVILGGSQNLIQGGPTGAAFVCAIIAGSRNKFTYSIGSDESAVSVNYSTIVSGADNCIRSSPSDFSDACAILAGQANEMSDVSSGAIICGDYNSISDCYGSACFGGYSFADKNSQIAHASGYSGQSSQFVLEARTTNNTPTAMGMGGSTNTYQNKLSILPDYTWGFEILVVARRVDADNESAFYKFTGCIDNNAGTTALVGSVTKTVVAEDTAAWDVNVTADNTDDCLVVTVTGENAKQITWTAFVRTIEVWGG